jgi:glycosyltransferase involved in cell wall biosynthesis
LKATFIVYDAPGFRGGPIVNMMRLLPRLQQRGVAVRVLGVIETGSPSQDVLERVAGIPVERLDTHPRLPMPERVRWILERVRENPPDLFVADNQVAGHYAARWARGAGIATAACFRSDDPFYWMLGDRFYWGEEPWRVGGINCVADSLRRRVSERVPAGTPVVHIPSGVPVPEAVADPARPGFKVCYVGRLVQEQKRILETGAALFRNLRAGVCDAAGFIGAGPEREALEQAAREAGVADRMRFHGEVAPELLPATLREYHALALLSDYEGTPGAVMDAMASGLVPVTTRLPDGTSELVKDGETGLLVDNRDGAFDRALETLAHDPERRTRLARAAREHIRTGYSIEVAVERWIQFSGELVARERRRGPLRPVRVPQLLRLPPALPCREDVRRPGLLTRAAWKVRGAARRTKRVLLGAQ